MAEVKLTKAQRDKMHRRAQIAEGLFEAIRLEIEGWNRLLEKPRRAERFDTYLFRCALRRINRLKSRAENRRAALGEKP